MHQHPQGHLIYADRGLLRVEAENGQWLVPPTAAVWLRSGVAHRLVIPVALQAHGLFFREDMCARLPASDCVVQVSPLLREAIIALAQTGRESLSSRRMAPLGALVVEEVLGQPTLPFHLPWPTSASSEAIARVCQAFVDNPADAANAGEWAHRQALGGEDLSPSLCSGHRHDIRKMVSAAAAVVLSYAADAGHAHHGGGAQQWLR